jgi:hypothetical protein
MGREELKRLMGSSFITFNKVCEYHKIPKSHWKLNGQYNYVEFKNGSRIDLLDLKYLPSDPLYQRFGSLEYTGGWIEEAGEVDFDAFDVLKSRIGRHKNDKFNFPAKMLLTCNPNKEWLYRVVYKPFRENTLSKKYAFIQSLYRDNPYTADSYGKELEQIDNEAQKQRLMYGNWEYDDNPRVLMDYDAICDLFRTELEQHKTPYLTIDIARHGKDRAVINRWTGWISQEILVFPKCDIDFLQEQARSICDKHIIPRRNVIADEDGVGGGFVDNFKCKGFLNNASAIQPPEAGYDVTKKVNFANLKTQCAFLLADKVNQRLIACKDKKHMDDIIEELGQIQEKDNPTEGKIKLVSKDEVRSSLGRSPDIGDTFVMRSYFDLKSTSFEAPEIKFCFDKWGRAKMI